MAHNGEGLAFVAEFEKHQPMTAADKCTKEDDKNRCSAIFFQPRPKADD